ncbi:hypothetical protein HMPREF2912_01550 [Corynebacterium sp. HMSC056E09]|uniref:hypothetical protein n=1 Tax=Corynebacterium sp. HMSC056E09 TaxID=1739416 RepID=UPI0008A369A9|nr:hypothetical protein [Corynebacterium sp. HMSC056E09]OFQ90670.1 hypothetical protein HMPREF2912_01550 [Corynebacterium sp. HMSC056E09]
MDDEILDPGVGRDGMYRQVDQWLHDTYSLENTFPEMSVAGFTQELLTKPLLSLMGGDLDAVRKYITNMCNHAVANKRDYLNQIAVLNLNGLHLLMSE